MKTNVLQPNRFLLTALMLAILASLLLATVRPAGAADTVSLNIVSVVQGQSVTIRVVEMPANKVFRVLMNKMGTQGVNGIQVGTGKTGSDGSFTQTYPIPAQLKEEAKIAIRVEATDNTGWYAYNWFVNSTGGSSNNGGSSSSGSSGVPTGNTSGSHNLTITDVEEDVSVEFQAQNLAVNRPFQVWFDWENRNGTLKGVQSGTIKSDNNGKIVAALPLPAAVEDRQEVRLRLQATSGSGTAAYAWFLNQDSDENSGGGAPASSTQGIPYLVMGPVVKNDSITFTAYNLPNKMEFDVYMGKYGTQAEDGIYIETVKSPKSGKSFEATVDIPKKLWDKEKIAIRLEAADGSGYYTYSWFYNSTDSTGQ